MDSTQVNKAIRSEVRPLLREHGFTAFTARSAWRFNEDAIDVINFQSFSSYNAGVMGCTTYSFSVNLGVDLAYLPNPQLPAARRTGPTKTKEHECPFRRSLRKQLPQPEYSDRSVWYIDAEGRYVDRALHDARTVILRDAFPWFERLHDKAEVLRTLLEDAQDMENTWGFGNEASPFRNYLLGHAALALDRTDLALEALTAAQSSGCFQEVASELEGAIARLR